MQDLPDVDLNNPQITVVNDWRGLLTAEFTRASNLILYRRPEPLKGDFNALAQAIIEGASPNYYFHVMGDGKFEMREGGESFIRPGSGYAHLESIAEKNEAARAALTQIQQDLTAICDGIGAYYNSDKQKIDRLNTYKGVLRVEKAFKKQDERVWHMDGTRDGARHQRILICYSGASTEGVYNADIPSKPMDQHGRDHKLSLSAHPFKFQTGDALRIAGLEWADKTTPFLHRTPIESDEARLLLVVDAFAR